jgi:hypothetical protein
MRRLILSILCPLAISLILMPVSVATAAASAACNQGTMTAHSMIPEGVPGHEHVPEC